MIEVFFGATKVDSESFLWFGGGAVLVLAVLQGIRLTKGGLFSANFARVFGLTLIATFAVSLAATDISDDAKTGAFTLLGTIAGYLAGARATKAGGSSDQGETVL